ncbi:hypothetical protein O3M35_011720 [Rhynocoris fuscipes]|uniref:Uncharacterized protein n=1 Tax=Rhynocoris fuscipes TaxID=488301 RepID=A0AAW1D1T4_9HEMI
MKFFTAILFATVFLVVFIDAVTARNDDAELISDEQRRRMICYPLLAEWNGTPMQQMACRSFCEKKDPKLTGTCRGFRCTCFEKQQKVSNILSSSQTNIITISDEQRRRLICAPLLAEWEGTPWQQMACRGYCHEKDPKLTGTCRGFRCTCFEKQQKADKERPNHENEPKEN